MNTKIVSEEIRNAQAVIDKTEFANTIRIQKAKNGFIVKTNCGPFIFSSLKESFDFIEKEFKP